MSQESINSNIENTQEQLKQQLLSGVIDVTEFKKQLIALDQSTDDRMHAIKNLEVLIDPEIISFVQNQPEEVQRGYYQTLSFTELHVGQIKALFEGRPEESLEYFKSSLDHEYKANAFPENIAYKKAIIAYFENDIPAMEQALLSDITGNNEKIVKNMLMNLKQRGSLDYKNDYGFGES